MNRLLNSSRTMATLRDPSLISKVAMAQIRDVLGGEIRSVTQLFLHEPFALGYAIGFAEQACRRAKKENGDESCPAYLLDAMTNILGDKAVAASFLSFAVSKKGDRTFEGGYDVGAGDMDAWCFSHTKQMPSSLSQYLGVGPEIRNGSWGR